jgi:hypothetical protein
MDKQRLEEIRDHEAVLSLIHDEGLKAETIEAFGDLLAAYDAQAKEIERLTVQQTETLSDDAVVAIRELLAAHDVPLAAFIDDHVGNAIVQRNEARQERDALTSQVRVLREAAKALYDACELRANQEGGDFGPDIGLAAEQVSAALAATEPTS